MTIMKEQSPIRPEDKIKELNEFLETEGKERSLVSKAKEEKVSNQEKKAFKKILGLKDLETATLEDIADNLRAEGGLTREGHAEMIEGINVTPILLKIALRHLHIEIGLKQAEELLPKLKRNSTEKKEKDKKQHGV